MAALRVGFAIPGDAAVLRDTISGGYAYDRRLIAGLRALGAEPVHLPLPRAFPIAGAADQAAARAALTGFDGVLLVDGLGFQSIAPDLAAALGPRLVALMHHPLMLEDGLTAAEKTAVEAGERAVMAAAAAVLVTSEPTARAAAEIFGLPLESIAVAPPGVDPAPRAAALGDPPLILSVGSVIPRKGYGALIAALGLLRDLDWRLEIIGPTDPDPAHAADLARQIAALGLEDRIALTGPEAPEALSARYGAADLFVSAATLEGYGMAAAEAINHGLPILAAAAAIADWAPHAARVAPPQDAAAFAAALRPLILDRDLRRAAAEASWRARDQLPRWERTAEIAADLLARVAASQAASRAGEG